MLFFQNVEQIFNCRVPIVKYRQDFLDLECDLSQCTSGFEMSALLYLWGNLDERVRPLVFVIRKWAKENDLVHELRQGLLNRWTLQLDLGCTTGGLERVVSVHNST